MEILSARQAAQLLGVNERTVRRWITNGKLDATKAAVNRYAIELDALPDATLKALLARIDRLEKAQEAQNAINRVSTAVSRQGIGSIPRDVESISHVADRPFLGHYRASFLGDISKNGDFTSVEALKRFLVRHGINKWTARDYYRAGCPRQPEAALQWVKDHIERTGYRAGAVSLRRCGSLECSCVSLV